MAIKRHVRQRAGDGSGIDLAPMLDFVMNLLIFFIITAVFTKEFSVPVARPSAGVGGPAREAGSLLVQIAANGDILVDDRLVNLRAVRANIERMHALKPENGVMVVSDPKAGTGLLVQVVDQIRQGGVTNVSFGVTR
jgi:biopolymer transport protein ExbD